MTRVDELKIAQLLLDRHRPADAEVHARKHLTHHPNDAWGHQTLALALNAQRQHREALEEAKLAISLAPEESHLYYSLANIYYHANLIQDCERAVDRAIELCPTAAPYWGLKANVKMAQDNFKGALSAADEGLRHSPTHIHCQNLRALALARLHRKDVALSGFEESLRQDPENALTFAYQGWMYVHHSDGDNALTAFAEALRLDPTNDWARTGMFHALREKHPLFHIARKVQRPVPMLLGWMGFMGGMFVSSMLTAMAAGCLWLAPLAVLSWVATFSLPLLLYLPTDMREDHLKAIMLFDKRGKYLLTPEERQQAVRLYWGCLVGLLIGIGFGYVKDNARQWNFLALPKLSGTEETAWVCLGAELVLTSITALVIVKEQLPEKRRAYAAGLLVLQFLFLPVAICSGLSFFLPIVQSLLTLICTIWFITSALTLCISGTRLHDWVSKRLESFSLFA